MKVQICLLFTFFFVLTVTTSSVCNDNVNNLEISQNYNRKLNCLKGQVCSVSCKEFFSKCKNKAAFFDLSKYTTQVIPPFIDRIQIKKVLFMHLLIKKFVFKENIVHFTKEVSGQEF